MDGWAETASDGHGVIQHGRSFRVAAHPLLRHAAREFCSGFEEGTLRFFDAVLPHCDRFIDFGAYVGFTTLYAATFGVAVSAFEPSPTNHALMAADVAANPTLAPRIHLFRHGIGAADGEVTLYAKGAADSGSSVFRDIERAGVVRGAAEATVPLRGAEYAVLPAIASLLAERKPWLHVSFHPFNLMAEDAYTTALLRAGLQAAEALASYRYMHLYSEDAWHTFGPSDRMDVLRHYLLQPKPIPRINTPQYGFIHAIAFSDQEVERNA